MLNLVVVPGCSYIMDRDSCHILARMLIPTVEAGQGVDHIGVSICYGHYSTCLLLLWEAK